MALQFYEDQICVDVRLESVETKLSEVQSAEKNLSEAIKNTELQLGGYHKEITSALASNSVPTNNSDPSTPLQVSEDSIAQIAASLVVDIKKCLSALKLQTHLGLYCSLTA